jgi:hypothetical protein
MKKSFALLLIAGAFLAGGAFGGFFWGYSKGLQEGFETGATQAQYHQNITNSVYLTLAARKLEAGDQREADRIRHLLLFGSALDIRNAIDSGSLSKETLEKTPPEGVLKEVAAYYWRHPETIKILDDDPARRHLKPRLLSLFEEYKTAEQGGRGDGDKPSN